MMHDHVVVPVAYSQRQKFEVSMCTKLVLKGTLVRDVIREGEVIHAHYHLSPKWY